MAALTEEQLDAMANLLSKMKGLGVLAKPGSPIPGPVVTGYPFQIPDSLPLRKFEAASKDFALAVGVEAVDIRRIGHEVVLFVPNKDRKTVYFLDALHWYLKAPEVGQMQLPILMGTNFKGEPKAIDLYEMPHLLIAGSTGSGKSVYESAIIASLSTAKSPSELEMILVDTKQLDLHLFEGLPHIKTVVHEISQWYPMMANLMVTVEIRKSQLKKAGARNILEYNRNVAATMRLPYITLIIDEFADLTEHDYAYRQAMKKAAREDDSVPKFEEPTVEEAVLRLIQVCRAVGIHIILCTQRTSVDIISGSIKANFPARISLRLPTGTDSRTILDETGAENLLGKGDMLAKLPDRQGVERYHGPFVKLDDISALLRDQEMIKKMLGVA